MSGRFTKLISTLLCFFLLFGQCGFAPAAGALDISGHLAQLHNSLFPDKFRPLHLRYLSYDNIANSFKLLLDKGDLKDLKASAFTDTAKTLLNYFFVGITLPNESFWVNLRPDSPDNIIDPELAKTDVGKILLEADLQLKKDTAGFTSPETPQGKEYWDKLYKKADELFGSENITIPALTRPWIVPNEIIIRETETNAYIYKATLKVLLEEDYLKGNAAYNFKDERLKTLNEYSSQLLRELIIPRLTKEVNTAKRYAPLRQVYYSLIMAQWFKTKFYGKGGLYSRLIDKKDLNALTSKTPWSKSAYFQAYQKSFKEGEYNLKIPVYTAFGQNLRSYMSGGIAFDEKILLTLKAGEVAGSPIKPEPPLNSHIISVMVNGGNPNNPVAIEITTSSPVKKEENPDLGLCLTPDSLIHLADGSTKPLIELKPFTNLRGSEDGADGNMVLSLNEATGRLEPHRLLALLDMGVKPVYRITTQGGKTLKTTLTHPYLTREGWKKLSEIKVGEEIRVAGEYSYSRSTSISDGRGDGLRGSGRRELLVRALNQCLEQLKDWLTPQSSFAGQIITPIAPTRVINSQEITLIPKGTFKKSEAILPANQSGKTPPIKVWDTKRLLSVVQKSLFSINLPHPGNKKYITPSRLSKDNLRTIFESIISIDYLGKMPVYDIEVEATHNFIAQGILAHNTYSRDVGAVSPITPDEKEEIAKKILSNLEPLVADLRKKLDSQGSLSEIEKVLKMRSFPEFVARI